MHEPARLTRRALAAALPLAALAGTGTVAAAAQASPDPVLAQIELHKTLVVHVNCDFPGDEGPAFQAACAQEEAAIQALGDMTPTTITGAAAQLQYMADVEGTFATGGSPLLQTVLTVAKALAGLGGGSLS